MLQSLAHALRNEYQEALTVLAQAVHLAEPEGYIRIFVDEGAAMATLFTRLREQERKQGPTPYLDTLLATFSPERMTHQPLPPESEEQRGYRREQSLIDPLSQRELDVLQLIAQGDSNQEIADQLVITLDTVKRHVTHIFEKLGVHNRVQAVARARTLGLLFLERAERDVFQMCLFFLFSSRVKCRMQKALCHPRRVGKSGTRGPIHLSHFSGTSDMRQNPTLVS